LISLFKEQIQQLVHTKDGAHAACLLLSYGTAKDRKAMVKSIREIIPQMSKDQFGHTVLIILCAVVDDTKLVSKSVLAELRESWRDLIRDKWGRKVVLFLCREEKDSLVKECREKSANTRFVFREMVVLTYVK
jgi:pumilio homology domain family member 6